MNAILMDNSNREKEINNYLQDKGVNTEGIVVWGHKYLINVKSSETFNEITKASKIEEISKSTGSLLIEFQREHHWWTIALDTIKTTEFLEKYKGEYKIE